MKKTSNRSGEKGNVMVAVMVAMFILSILGMAKLTMARLDAVETDLFAKQNDSLYCAQKGADEFYAIVSDFDNRATFQGLNLVGDSGTSTVFDESPVTNSYGQIIGNFTLTLEPTTFWSDFFTQVNGYKMVSTGRATGSKQAAQITVFARTTTVAEQVWGSNSEGGIWFVTHDKLYGSIHSNDRYHIDGKPLFTNGVAKTHAANVEYKTGISSWIDPQVFTGGLKYDQPLINFNSEIITEMRDSAAVTYPNNTKIVFKGTQYDLVQEQITTVTNIVRKKKVVKTVTNIVTTTHNISSLGASTDDDNIIYVTGTVTVSGHVGAPVSVVAEKAVLVDASGTYHGLVYTSKKSDPNPQHWLTTPPPEAERIGLFAVDKVMVIGTSVNNPINLHASLYIATGETSDAVNDRGFCVSKYNVDYNTPYINFYGSMVQKLRGAVGQVGGNGFLKNYNQDLRFLRKPPPATPITAPKFYGWSVAYVGAED